MNDSSVLHRLAKFCDGPTFRFLDNLWLKVMKLELGRFGVLVRLERIGVRLELPGLVLVPGRGLCVLVAARPLGGRRGR